MIKIRLSRCGVKKKPFYKIVVSDIRFPRDGKFIEKIGFFNPIGKKKENKLKLIYERIDFWINKGAKLSKTIKNIIKKDKTRNA